MKFCIYGKNEFPSELNKNFAVFKNDLFSSSTTVVDFNKETTLIPTSAINKFNIDGETKIISYGDCRLAEELENFTDLLFERINSSLGSQLSREQITYVADIGFDKEVVFFNIKTARNTTADGNGAKIILAKDILEYGDLIFYGSNNEYFLFRYPHVADDLNAQEILDDPENIKIYAKVNENYRLRHDDKIKEFTYTEE